MEESHYFSIIPAHVLCMRDISANAKLALAFIGGMVKSRGYCYASNNYIAECLGLSKSGIERILRELKEKDLVSIIVIKDGNGAFIERKIFVQYMVPPTSLSGTPTYDNKVPLPHNGKVPSPTAVSTNNKERYKNRYIKDYNKDLPSFLDKDLFQDFIDMRAAIKKPLTERAADLIIQELGKAEKEGHCPETMLKRSIMNSWQGVFKNEETKAKAKTKCPYVLEDYLVKFKRSCEIKNIAYDEQDAKRQFQEEVKKWENNNG